MLAGDDGLPADLGGSDAGGDIDDLCAGMEESGIAGADDAATALLLVRNLGA